MLQRRKGPWGGNCESVELMQAISGFTERRDCGENREKNLQGEGRRGKSAGVKLTQTDRDDILGGTVFLLLLAVALFLSCFL